MSESVNSQSTAASDFQFVTESNCRALRSYAMRSHWRVRKQRASGRRSAGSGSQLHLQPLRPRVHHSHVLAIHQAERASDTGSSSLTSYEQLPDMGDLTRATSEALCSAMGTLSGGRLDPFDSLPVRLATVHHRLLYHCMLRCRIPLGIRCCSHTHHRAFHECDNDVQPSPSFNPRHSARCMATT